MAITIKDFVLQLGFDTGPVDKGLAALNAKFNKVAQTIQRSENSRNKASQTGYSWCVWSYNDCITLLR